MTTHSYLIDYYRVNHYAVLVGDATDTAAISCYQGSTYAGRLVFVDEDDTVPDSEFDSNGDFVIYYGIDRFGEVLNTFKDASEPVLVEVVPDPNSVTMAIDSAYVSRDCGVEQSNMPVRIDD